MENERVAADGKLDYQEFIRMMMEAKNESMVKILYVPFPPPFLKNFELC